jgi:hypothetical protein
MIQLRCYDLSICSHFGREPRLAVFVGVLRLSRVYSSRSITSAAGIFHLVMSSSDRFLSRTPRTSNPKTPAPARAPGIVGGTFEYFAATEGIPSGYTSITELAEYPKSLFLALFGADVAGSAPRRRRFESLLSHGLVLHTDFSGKGTVEQSFRMIDVTAKDRLRSNPLAFKPKSVPKEWL